MEERKMEDLMIDYVEGNLKGELKEHVERTIEKNKEWKLEYERLSKVLRVMNEVEEYTPNTSLRKDFDAMLKEEMGNLSSEAKTIAMKPVNSQWFMRIAASVAMVTLAAVIIVLVMKNQRNEEQLALLKNEMELTRNLVMSSLQNQASASNRLSAVNTVMDMKESDKEITMALINVMNTDNNTNVRLAAVSALSRFSDEIEVRNELLKALETQEDPLVLINLINLMVQLKERGAIEPMKTILEKKEVLDAVKDEAQMGLFKLS